MSEYDPYDDIQIGLGFSFTVNKSDYISCDLLYEYWNIYPFYIQDNVDSSIDNWYSFVESLIENGELSGYKLIRSLDNGKMEIAQADTINDGIFDCDYFSLEDIYFISHSYGITSKENLDKNMEGIKF